MRYAALYLILALCLTPSVCLCKQADRTLDANQVRLLLQKEKVSQLESVYSHIASLEGDLNEARASHIVPVERARKTVRKTYPDKESKQKDITRIRGELSWQNAIRAGIEANDMNWLIDTFMPPFQVGQIGKMGTGSGHVSQSMRVLGIVDSRTALVEYTVDEEIVSSGGSGGFGSTQGRFLTGRSSGGVPYPVTKTIWLTGIDTTGLVDRSEVIPPRFMIITGTKDYETVLGAKQTVFVFEPLEIPSGW